MNWRIFWFYVAFSATLVAGLIILILAGGPGVSLMLMERWVISTVIVVSAAYVEIHFFKFRREVRAQKSPKKYLPGWPRFWDLFGFCLPRRTRDKVYEPGRNELLEDYLLSRKYRTKWARRWLTCCFTFRTILLIADCWWVLLKDGAVKIVLGLIPWLTK